MDQRPNRPTRRKRLERRRAEFRESLGASQQLAAADMASATYVTLWVAIVLAIAALASVIAVNLLNTPTATSSVPAGTILPIQNASLDTIRAAESKGLATTPDLLAVGEQSATAPVTSMANQYTDTYALQGSVGTTAVRHVEPTP